MTSREYFEQVIRPDPRMQSSDKTAALELLEPVTRDMARAFLAAAAHQGLDVRIIETARSVARQRLLFARGATQRREVGCHQMAVAFDAAIFSAGKPDWRADYGAFAELALQAGLIWGGDWGRPDLPHSWTDRDHLQRVSIADQGRLFRGEWYPEPGYDPRAKPPAAPVDLAAWLSDPPPALTPELLP